MALVVHCAGINHQDYGSAVPCPNVRSGLHISRQVHVMPVHAAQAFALYRCERPSARTVIQNLWRSGALQPQVNRHAVPLFGSNASVVRIEREALLVTGSDYLTKL